MDRKSDIFLTTVVIAFIITIIALLTPLFIKSESNERITDVRWYREVHISTWKTVSKTGDYVPSRGRQTDSWSESKKVCNTYKDGKCESYRTEYDTKYRYDIEEWVFTKKLVTYGSNKNPVWANVEDLKWAADINNPRIGDEKAYKAVESYTLILTEKPNEYVTSFGEWNQFDIEDLVTVTRNGYSYPISIKLRQ